MIGKQLKDKSKSRGQKERKKEVRGLTFSEQRFGLFNLKNENDLYVEYSCEHTQELDVSVKSDDPNKISGTVNGLQAKN